MSRFQGAFSLILILTLLASAPALRAQQRATERALLDNFAGVWVETHPHSGPPMRLQLLPAGDRIEIWFSYRDVFPSRPERVAAIENDRLTWSTGQGCAMRWRSPGYDYTSPGVNTFWLRLGEVTVKGKQTPALLYMQEVQWNAPCGGHPIGKERIEKTLLRHNGRCTARHRNLCGIDAHPWREATDRVQSY
jgi:hypothetical protein